MSHFNTPYISDLAKDTVAGLMAAVVLITNIVSFAALMFPGELNSGVPIAVWSMLIGSCIGGTWIALKTSIPPLASSIDSPTGTVLVLLSSSIGSSLIAVGYSPALTVQTTMLIFTAATLMSGGLLYSLGVLKWGAYFRFVPHFVIGGFLAATGYLLFSGGFRLSVNRPLVLTSFNSSWGLIETSKLFCGFLVLAILLALRRWVKLAYAMPVAIFVLCLLGFILLKSFGLADAEQGWYLHDFGRLTAWSPFEFLGYSFDWLLIIKLLPELLAVTIVALISLITKVSSLEVARQVSGDLNNEFKAHGLASLFAAPFGGLTCGLQVGTSRLLEHVGGATRMSGVVCALLLGLVGLANFNLPGLFPIPIVAGLVFYLGYTFIVDALWRPFKQQAWLDLLLTVSIMIICVNFGFLLGVLAGLISACLMFAVSYARLGIIRRHASRATFASYVDRSPQAAYYLHQHGERIQIYWLSGYIFFGSSEGLFERIRSDVAKLSGRVDKIVLDFSQVSGADASTITSLIKLRNFCKKQNTAVFYCALLPTIQKSFISGGLFIGNDQAQIFADLDLALIDCEDHLLTKLKVDINTSAEDFEPWLQQQLGSQVDTKAFMAYLQRLDIDQSQNIYRQGEPADSIVFVATGRLVVEIAKGEERQRLRHISTHSVLGEMGFFRQSVRSTDVYSDGAAILFTLTRSNYQRMSQQHPDLVRTFDNFIIRLLADRLDIANNE